MLCLWTFSGPRIRWTKCFSKCLISVYCFLRVILGASPRSVLGGLFWFPRLILRPPRESFPSHTHHLYMPFPCPLFFRRRIRSPYNILYISRRPYYQYYQCLQCVTAYLHEPFDRYIKLSLYISSKVAAIASSLTQRSKKEKRYP